MATETTGAPADLEGGMPATDSTTARPTDPLDGFDSTAREAFRAMADVLIPEAHGMPSAGHVITDDRLRFVLDARPDLREPLGVALRPELGDEPRARLTALESGDAQTLSALQLVVVGAYYTDKRVRELIGYPGQMAIEVRSWEYPIYLEEGLIDQVLARGPVYRDPNTGKRAVATEPPRIYAEREWTDQATTAEGGD